MLTIDFLLLFFLVSSPFLALMACDEQLRPFAGLILLLGGAYLVFRVTYIIVSGLVNGGGALLGRRSNAVAAELSLVMSRVLRMGGAPGDVLPTLEQDLPVGYRGAILRVAAKLKEGLPLHQALASIPRLFSVRDRALIEAGEKSGRLADAFEFLSIARPRSGAINPGGLSLVAVFLGVLTIPLLILAFILPKFKEIFDQLGADLPFLTQVLMDFNHLLTHSPFLLLLLLAVILVVVVSTCDRVGGGLSLLLAVFPSLRRSYWSDPFSRFSFVMGSLLGSGAGVEGALMLALKSSGSKILQGRRRRFEQVHKTSEISGALNDIPGLPADFSTEYLRDDQDDLPERLMRVSRIHALEHQAVIGSQWAVLVPVAVFALLVLCIVIVVALYLPMFNIPKVVGRG